jgi:hypothetical protein
MTEAMDRAMDLKFERMLEGLRTSVTDTVHEEVKKLTSEFNNQVTTLTHQMNSLQDQMHGLSEGITRDTCDITERINCIQVEINDVVKNEVSQMHLAVDKKMEKLKEESIKPDELEKRLGPMELRQAEMEIDVQDIKKSVADIKKNSATGNVPTPAYNVIIKNLELSEREAMDENVLLEDVTELLRDGLKITDSIATTVTRMRPIPIKNGTKPGHVLVTFSNKQQQLKVLKSKRHLKKVPKYEKVWIEVDKPREVRAMERNCRVLLKEIGKEKEYYIRGSTLVKKGSESRHDDGLNQQDTADATNHMSR